MASIGLEELALSHLLNAEAEKIQSVLGTLGCKDPKKAKLSEIIKVNKSVERTLRDVIRHQMLLQFKLEDVLDFVCDDFCKDGHRDKDECDED